MLLTELILSKRGPLAKVWLSAHQERKLTKQQALGVDVEESVDAILEQEDGAITLRLSGQLMLGVTRIYSRKVQYLLDDCKETRERITLAFRPGIVDLPEDQIRASKNAITFSDMPNDFNFIDWSWAAPPPELAISSTTAAQTQLNLRPANREFGAYNFGRPSAPSIYGRSSTSRHPSQDVDTSSHLDSQDFSGIDLGLGLDDFDMSIERGRDAASNLSREGSIGRKIRGASQDIPSIHGDMGMDLGFEGVDLGLDFGDQPELPMLEERGRRETSALSTPPPVSPPQLFEVTPRTAARIQRPEATQKVKRPRLLHADEELELPDEDFVAPGQDSAILTEERFIPSDPELVRLRDIAADPNSHFLPTTRVGGVNMIYAGPEGLAPELAELFTFPSNILRRDRGEGEDDVGPAAKRQRLAGQGEEEDEVEAARRGSMLPPSERGFGGDFGQGADETFDLGNIEDIGAGGDFFQPDIMATPRGGRKEASLAPSRAESIARAVQFGEDTDHPLAMFDSRRTESQSQSLLETPTKSVTSEERTRGGYSKHTGMAMGLLRKELEAIEEEDKVVEFQRVADKASRKAASAFFFELLVLGTRDCIRLEQDTAFGEIKVRSKPSLFEEITA